MKAATRDPGLALVWAVLAGAAALWLDLLTTWSAETAALVGRAMLGATGKADLAPLLAAYPPIPYVLLSLVVPLARPIGLDPAGLLAALLVGGFAGVYVYALREARFDRVTTAVFALIFCMHPFVLWGVTAGPDALLLFWGVYLFGTGLFGFRTTGGVNQLITLTLSLPLLAFTSVHGALIAVSSIPFLLLAVPPQLLQRAYGSVYVVLLFPLVFGLLAMCVIAAILLHDPWGFVPTDVLHLARGTDRPWWFVAAASTGAVIGTMVIAPGMILRVRTRRPLQSAAVALLGTMVLSVVLAAATGIVENAVEALAPTAAAAAVVTTRWPLEPHRVLRTGALIGIGLLAASSVAFTNRGSFQPTVDALARHPAAAAQAPDEALGRFLQDKQGVMIDALAHPAVVAARGSTRGLLTQTTPAFAVALLRRRLDAPHLAVKRHDAGQSDDVLGRLFPDLYDRGAPGYALSYDDGGWRIWSRIQPRKAGE